MYKASKKPNKYFKKYLPVKYCDRDSDCESGLRCGTNNCNNYIGEDGYSVFDDSDDCCHV